jgi:putative oxidoreductase
MLIQFAVRQLSTFSAISHTFPSVLGMGSEASLIVMICIEMICSVFIMFGFLTRLMTLPPFVAMIIAEYHLLHDTLNSAPYMLNWQSMGYLPVMFLGIYFFILLVGPGKISVDYFLSLHLIHSEDKSEDEELEEV